MTSGGDKVAMDRAVFDGWPMPPKGWMSATGFKLADLWHHLARLIGTRLGLAAHWRAKTELRESARQLRLERALLQGVLQQAPIGISIAGAGPRAPTMINAYAEAMLGHGIGGEGPGESRYASYGALHLDGRRYLPAEYPTMRALRAGEIVRAEEMGYRNARTGEVRRIEVSSAPVHDADGTTQAAVTVLVDVEDVRRARDKLEDAQRSMARLLREGEQRQAVAERAHACLSRYFSPNVAERLAGDPFGLEPGGVRREVASLFTDITGFTGLVESLDPAQLAEILNDYLSVMTGVVFEHEGTVAKIVGDAIHVLFGAPGDQPDHAARAVACALALDAAAETFHARWIDRGIAVGVTRIGVHAGPAIVGNFGGERFFDYTAYGDTINTAARLEGANKHFGTRICVSGAAAARAGAFRGRPVGDLVLRGKQETLRAFEPVTEATYDARSLERYRKAFAKLDAGEASAMPSFAALVGSRPDDTLAGFHLRRLLNGASGTRIEVV